MDIYSDQQQQQRRIPEQSVPRMSQSNSSDMMPPPIVSPTMGPSPVMGMPTASSSSSSLSSSAQNVGRGQSAFNFILSKASKAKSSFAPNGSQHPPGSFVNPSSSIGSLASLNEEQGAQYQPRPLNQAPFPGSPYGGHSLAPAARSSSIDFRRTGTSADSDYGVQPLTSPSKRGFFSRERKNTSAAPPGRTGGHRNAYGMNSGRGNGTGAAIGSHYGQFSKSQSDLHSRTGEFPSPASMTVDLPKVPNIPQAALDDRSSLRSPSFNNMSRSVEDLSHTSSSLPRSTSPQPFLGNHGVSNSNTYASASGTTGTWGEHGIPAQSSWGRPSDVGTIKPSPGGQHNRSRQSSSNSIGINRAVSPSGSRADSIPFSSASGSAPWPSQQRGPSPSLEPVPVSRQSSKQNASHQRKGSKFGLAADAFFSSGQPSASGSVPSSARERKATGSSLASSFSLGNVAAGASSVMDKLRGAPQIGGLERPPSSGDSPGEGIHGAPLLPPGAIHQGFLNRNGNLSLTLQQLGGGREREKDISKGWKPYRVVLKDHALYFYKPPSNVGEEAKALFPSGVVKNLADEFAGAGSSNARFDAEALKQSGLGMQALLTATSSSAIGNGDVTGTSSSVRLEQAGQNSRSASTSPSKKAVLGLTALDRTTEAPGAASAVPWHIPGKHAELELSTARERPSRWAERIENGSLEALTHEIIFATQLIASDDPGDTAHLVQATLFSLLYAGRFVNDFITHLHQHSAAIAASQTALTPAAESAIAGRVGWCFDILTSCHAGSINKEGVDALQALVQSINLQVDVHAALDQQGTSQIPRSPPTDWLSQTALAARPKLAPLAAGHLSGADLLEFDPAMLAAQIQAFHVDRMQPFVKPVPAVSSLIEPTDKKMGTSSLILSFSAASPHYLTRLILEQVLGSEPPQAARGQETSLLGTQARHRARLLRHWIAIASWSLAYGDVVAWAAVMVALCSRAISRLEHTWRLVAEGDRMLVGSSWANKLAALNWGEDAQLSVNAAVKVTDITSKGAKAIEGKGRPGCIPFLGDALPRALSAHRVASGKLDPAQLPIAPLASNASRLYSNCQNWVEAASSSKGAGPSEGYFAVNEPIVEFQQLLQRLATTYESSPEESVSSSKHLEASLAFEPPSLGTVDLSWRPPLPAVLAARAILPLIFPESLPTLDLLDRREIVDKAASDDIRAISSNAQMHDPDATIRVNTQRYVRSPLSGTPLVRASLQSLTRTKGNASPSARISSTSLPFNKVAEWGAGRLVPEEETLYRIGNDLLLKASDEVPASLPASPLTGKRFSQDFGSRGARPLSQVSKRSSLPTSNRSSLIDAVIPTQVLVKAGTLERLVDVLILGVSDLFVSPSDDATHDTAPAQAAKRSRLTMDLNAYRMVFLATFRSMCSPLVLFDFLRKRYLAAVNAGREVSSLPTQPNASRFPGWSLIDASAGAASEPVDWDFVARVRHGVCAVFRLWITRFTTDFADDQDLYDGIFNFGKQQAALADTADSEDADFARASASLQDTIGLLRLHVLQMNLKHSANNAKPTKEKAKVTAERPFDFDASSAIELVDYLECIGRLYFGKITERDWLAAAEVFDCQAADPLGWHIVRNKPRSEDAQGHTMYKLLEALRSPTESEHNHGLKASTAGITAAAVPVSHRLPAAIRDACGAQSLLRGWVAIHIIEQHIGMQLRQDRIEKLLDAIWLCRARMLNLRLDEGGSNPLAGKAPLQDATIGSFVENIIVASLTAPESRTFVRAWQGVCHARGATGESFEDLVPKSSSLSALNQAATKPATPDVGWVLRSLAQAVSRKSAAAQADSTFIDFGRQQLVFDLIESALAIRRRAGATSDVDAELAATRLPMMQEKLRKVHWDSRAFREDAAQEAATAPPLPRNTTWRAHRPLQAVLLDQADKYQRDRTAYETLSSALDAAKVTANRSPMLGLGDHHSRVPLGAVAAPFVSMPLSPSHPPAASEKKSRRMTSLWRGATRFGGGNDKVSPVTEGVHRSYQDLLVATPMSQKPSLVINLASADVHQWKNLQRSFTFHVNSHDGQRVLLQATDHAELLEWLQQIEQAVREAPPRSSISDARKYGVTGGRATRSNAVVVPFFGLDLVTLTEREGRPVPLALQRMLAEIEARGLQEIGIYRISGSKVTIDALQQAFKTRPAESIDLQHGEFSDVHVLSNLVKLWLRELPEPVVPFAFYRPMIAIESMTDVDERLINLRELIWKFPRPHFDLLKVMCEHFARVVDEGDHNKMLTHNIGLIFGTSLLNPAPSPSAVAEGFAQLGQRANLVKLMVSYYDWIFDPEPEPEAEADGDADGDADADAEAQTGVEPEGDGPAATVTSPSIAAGSQRSLPGGTEAAIGASDLQASGVSSAEESKARVEMGLSGVNQASASEATNHLLAQLEADDLAVKRPDGLQASAVGGEAPSINVDQSAQEPQANTSLSVADASRAGQALKRPDLPNKDSRREELSIYADALDIDLSEASTDAALRSSLLPDDAMLDILRLMNAQDRERGGETEEQETLRG